MSDRERDELRAENRRLARRYELASDKAADLRAEVARVNAQRHAALAEAQRLQATVMRVEAICESPVGHLTISQSESGTQPLAGEWVRLADLRAALYPEEAPDA